MLDPIISLDHFSALADSTASHIDPSAVARHYAAYRKSDVDAIDYLQGVSLKEGQILLHDILDCLPDKLPAAESTLARFYRSRKVDIIDTISGYAVTVNAKTCLIDFLAHAVPIKPLFNDWCWRNSENDAPSRYQALLDSLGKAVVKEPNNPCSDYREYLIGNSEDASALIATHMCSISGTANTGIWMTGSAAAKFLSVSNRTMEKWMVANCEKCKELCGSVVISADTVHALESEWHSLTLIDEHFLYAHFEIPTDVGRYLVNGLRNCDDCAEFLVLPIAFPQQSLDCSYCRCESDGISAVRAVMRAPLIPLMMLEDIGYTYRYLKKSADSGNVPTSIINGKYYMAYKDYADQLEFVKSMISLDNVVNDIISTTPDCRFHLSRVAECAELLIYCNDHKWWGIRTTAAATTVIESKYTGLLISAVDKDCLSAHIALYIALYKQDNEMKFDRILEIYERKFPVAATMVRDTFDSTERPSNLWQFADMLFACLNRMGKDINLLTKQEKEKIAADFRANCPLSICSIFSDFAARNSIMNQLGFERSGYKKTKQAYPLEDFAVIVSHACSPSVWRECDLISKALKNPTYADLWLYVACHVYSTLRGTDYVRLPAPELDAGADDILAMIDAAQADIYFSAPCQVTEIARRYAKKFIFMLDCLSISPNKTSTTPNVSPLYFYIPESCYDTFGVILLLAAAHYYKSPVRDSFVVPRATKTVCMNFFGTAFLQACGHEAFSGLRASKSLLQSVETEARERSDVSPYIAYSLASVMRSHKGGLSHLPESTAHYLRDANFAGLDADAAVRELFERGFCSFCTDRLLEIVYGQDYKGLSVRHKTAVIKSVGLDVYQLDQIRLSVATAQQNSYEVVDALTQGGIESAKRMLDNILSGQSMGKSYHSHCLCMASDLDCGNPTRQGCLGCKYEITTKALLGICAAEYYRLGQPAGSEAETKKNEYLRETVIGPILGEIVAHLPQTITKDEFDQYCEIKMLAEGGEQHATA